MITKEGLKKQAQNVKKIKKKLPTKEDGAGEESISIKEKISSRKDIADFNTAFISRRGVMEINHNNFAFIEGENYACWALADGYNGSGEAAQIIIDEIMKAFMMQVKYTNAYLKKIIKNAEKVLNEMKRENPHLKDQLTSLAIVLSDYNSVRIAHIGNIRVYHLLDGLINFKTNDHSVAQLIFDANKMGEKEIRFHTRRNDLTRAIGAKKNKVQIEKHPIRLGKGDSILFSTIGAWENFDERDLEIEYTKSEAANDWVVNLEKRVFAAGVKEIGNYSIVGINIKEVVEESNSSRKKRNWLLWIPLTVLLLIVLIFSIMIISSSSKNKKAKNVINQYISESAVYLEKQQFNESVDLLEKAKEESLLLISENNGRNALSKKITNVKLKNYKLEKQNESVDYRVKQISKLINVENDLLKIDELAETYSFEEAVELCEEVMGVYNNIEIEENSNVVNTLKSELLQKKSKLEQLIVAMEFKAEGDEFGEKLKFDEALIKYSDAKEIFLKFGDMKMVTEINDSIEGFSQEREKLIDTALLYENNGYDAEAKNPVEAIDYFKSAIGVYKTLENNSRVEALTDKIAKLKERINKELKKADELFGEALIFESAQQYEEAKTKLIKAKEIYKSLNANVSLKKTEAEIGKVKELQKKKIDINKAFSLELDAKEKFLNGEYNEAKTLYNKAIGIFEINKHDAKIKELESKLLEVDGATYESIADLNLQDSQYAASMSNYNKAIENYRKYGDEKLETRVREKYEKAEDEYNYSEAKVLEDKANQLYKDKSYEEAHENYTQSKKHYEKLQDYEPLEDKYDEIMKNLNKKIKKSKKKMNKKGWF